MTHSKRRQGMCALCGIAGDLTFEHIPPRKAFNERRTIHLPWNEAMRLGPDVPIKGKIQQGGVGAYTLCPPCNNNTGAWYAKSLVDWCYRGMEILGSNRHADQFGIPRCRPLRVLKQIMAMFVSVNPKMTGKQPWLRRLLLNRESRDWEHGWRLFVYYNVEGKLRHVGAAGQFDINTGRATILSEINYPPFGYVLVMNDDLPPDSRLAEITRFREYLYDDLVDIWIPMSVLPTHLMYPGDYRKRKEILRDREAAFATRP